MKKVIAIALALILIGAAAYAAIDLSGMSFDELMDLRKQVELAIWASGGWTHAEVPAGVYYVGEDIPADRWTLYASGKFGLTLDIYDADGKVLDYYYVSSGQRLNLTLEDGWCLKMDDPATFVPFTGAALGFK